MVFPELPKSGDTEILLEEIKIAFTQHSIEQTYVRL
jgi:hypothetical protein